VIWLTWRQQRPGAVLAAAGLAVAVAGLVWLELSMAGAADHLGLGRCTNMRTQECLNAAATLGDWFAGVRPVLLFFVAIPLLLGMFVGAPLVAAEIEQGTHWVVWTQSVGRGTWLLGRVTGALLLGVAAAAVLTLAVNWAVAPLLQVFIGAQQTNQLDQPWFDVLGVVPVAYTAFALTLGIASGTLLRRTLPAMLAVLVVFLVVRLSISQVRADYQPPITVSTALRSASEEVRAPAGAWVTDAWITDRSGQRVAGLECGPGTDQSCAGYTRWIAYQPADRYWPFQAIESGIYVVLSLLLLALTAHWVRRRVT
jgi:hypothetical protein